jgi:hypothetical protein
MKFRLLAAMLMVSGVVAPAARVTDTIQTRQYLADIKHLTSNEFKGRASGSPELDKAAHFLVKEFQKAGLRPLGRSFLQAFPVSEKSNMGVKNAFSYTIGGQRTTLVAGQGFVPFSFSASGAAHGPVVFAGYGVTAPEVHYDDYAGLDVRGKIVLILRHEPQEFNSESVFEGRVYSEHSQLFSKALNARAHGAIAVLYVNDTATHGSDELEKFVSLPGPADPGIPFIQVASEHVEAWFAASGREFKHDQEEIDRTLVPQSFPLSDSLQVELQADVQHTARDVSNVVGYLPGTTDEYVIVGAHYDHLGLGEQFSLAPEKAGFVHPGADDNASGVAGLLALARHFGSHSKPVRGIVFIAFAGEELGLLGSVHYANHPLLPVHNARLMINMDMIGRIRDRKVMVGGAPAGSSLRTMLDTLGAKYNLDLDLSDSTVYGSSDHTSFKSKQIQTLFFFSGLHADYHRPTDTWEKIDASATVQLLHLIADLLTVFTTPASKPQFAAEHHNIRIFFNTASMKAEESAIKPITMPQECGESANGICFKFIPYIPVITSAGVAMVPNTVSTFIA